jgi:hypothetical protein
MTCMRYPRCLLHTATPSHRQSRHGVCSTPSDLRVGVYPYPLRVRCWRVRVRCWPSDPRCDPCGTLVAMSTRSSFDFADSVPLKRNPADPCAACRVTRSASLAAFHATTSACFFFFSARAASCNSHSRSPSTDVNHHAWKFRARDFVFFLFNRLLIRCISCKAIAQCVFAFSTSASRCFTRAWRAMTCALACASGSNESRSDDDAGTRVVGVDDSGYEMVGSRVVGREAVGCVILH